MSNCSCSCKSTRSQRGCAYDNHKWWKQFLKLGAGGLLAVWSFTSIHRIAGGWSVATTLILALFSLSTSCSHIRASMVGGNLWRRWMVPGDGQILSRAMPLCFCRTSTTPLRRSQAGCAMSSSLNSGAAASVSLRTGAAMTTGDATSHAGTAAAPHRCFKAALLDDISIVLVPQSQSPKLNTFF